MTISAVALLLLAPVLARNRLAIRIGSPGPVFYRGLRMGAYGRTFRILKFRSMVVNAEALGGSATAQDDARITPLGAFLRRYKLDELPQLFQRSGRGYEPGRAAARGPEVRRHVSREEQKNAGSPSGHIPTGHPSGIRMKVQFGGSSDPERTYEELIRPTKLALQLYYLRISVASDRFKFCFTPQSRLGAPRLAARRNRPIRQIKRFRGRQPPPENFNSEKQ